MLKKCMPLWREAHVEVRMWKAHNARTTVGRSTAPHDVITTSTATTATTTARTITTTATTASTATITTTTTSTTTLQLQVQLQLQLHLHYITPSQHYTTRHYTALHCTAPHCTTRPPNINNDDDYYYYCYYCYFYCYCYTYNYNYLFTTTSAMTTTTSTLYHTASSRCGLDGHCNHSKKHKSNHLSVHQSVRSAIHASQQLTSPLVSCLGNFRHRLRGTTGMSRLCIPNCGGGPFPFLNGRVCPCRLPRFFGKVIRKWLPGRFQVLRLSAGFAFFRSTTHAFFWRLFWPGSSRLQVPFAFNWLVSILDVEEG